MQDILHVLQAPLAAVLLGPSPQVVLNSLAGFVLFFTASANSRLNVTDQVACAFYRYVGRQLLDHLVLIVTYQVVWHVVVQPFCHNAPNGAEIRFLACSAFKQGALDDCVKESHHKLFPLVCRLYG